MKEKTIMALLEMGAHVDFKGFDYIISVMGLYERHGSYFTNMQACYEWVAKQHKTTWEVVMDDIAYLLQYLITNGNGAAVVKYLGFMPKKIEDFLAMMYRRLKEEE